MRRPKGATRDAIDHGDVNRGQEKVSKAALFGTLLAVGLLDPAPSPPSATAASPRAVLAATRPAAPSSCTTPRRELRFEMIRSEAEAYSPPAPRPVCLAVYRP
jgi:hypothetical protein